MAGSDLSRKTRAAKIAMPFKFPLGPENMPEVFVGSRGTVGSLMCSKNRLQKHQGSNLESAPFNLWAPGHAVLSLEASIF